MEGFINLILEPINEVYLKFKGFSPNFLAMLSIIVIGSLIAWFIKKVLLSRKLRQLVRQDGVHNPSEKG